MKQYITISQLQELTIEQQDKLRDWWRPQKHNLVAYTYKYYNEPVTSEIIIKGLYNGNPTKVEDVSDLDGEYVFMKDNCLPLLSIGQCIELLEYLDNIFIIECGKNSYELFKEYIDFKNRVMFCASTEFIEALWVAVKFYL